MLRNGFNNGSTNGRNGCGSGLDEGNGSSANNGLSDGDHTYSGLDLDSADGALGGHGSGGGVAGVGPPFRVLKKADVELKVGGKPKQYSVVIKVLPTDDPGEPLESHNSRNLF